MEPNRKILELEYTQAKQIDYDFLKSIHHEAYRDVVIRQFGEWDENLQDNFFKNEWDYTKFKTITFQNEVVGYFSLEEEKENLFLAELVISNKFQGKGIGSQVLKSLQSEAKNKSLPIRLQVLKENNAKSLYLRYGFKQTGETEIHFLMSWSV